MDEKSCLWPGGIGDEFVSKNKAIHLDIWFLCRRRSPGMVVRRSRNLCKVLLLVLDSLCRVFLKNLEKKMVFILKIGKGDL